MLGSGFSIEWHLHVRLHVNAITIAVQGLHEHGLAQAEAVCLRHMLGKDDASALCVAYQYCAGKECKGLMPTSMHCMHKGFMIFLVTAAPHISGWQCLVRTLQSCHPDAALKLQKRLPLLRTMQISAM